MKIDRIFYSNSVPLPATIEVPDTFANPGVKFPAVILCHGHSRHKNDGLDVLAENLLEEEIVTIRFDFRGCGEGAANRYHLYCASEWSDDLQNALSFAQSLPYVDDRRMGVAGISMGAATAVYVSGIDDRIRSAVSMGGISDCEAWLKGVWERSGGSWQEFLEVVKEDSIVSAATGMSKVVNVLEMYNSTSQERAGAVCEACTDKDVNCYLTLDSLMNLLKYKPIEKCQYIHNPIFFIHGEDDVLVPPMESQIMYEKVPTREKRIKLYKGVDHNIPRAAGREAVFKDIVGWFKDSL